MEIKPFNELPLIKFFQHDLEKIMMAFRLSDTIRNDAKNIRAAGDEVELAVKEFFHKKLYPRYHVSSGHIVDSKLKVSPQYDIIISDNTKNPVLFYLADKSEIIYFEPVFLIAEVKRSFYKKDLVADFSKNLERLKKNLVRKEIEPNYIDAGNVGILVEEPLTKLPMRNPMLSFMFFIDSAGLKMDDLGVFLNSRENQFLPNYMVLLDIGVIVNIDKKEYENGNIRINLYPGYELKENLWVLIEIPDSNNVLIYQYMLAIEHLNSSMVSIPDVRSYTSKLFNISFSDIHTL